MSLQLIPGQTLDWGEPLESGPDSEEFLQPPVDPTPAEKKVSWRDFLFLLSSSQEASDSGQYFPVPDSLCPFEALFCG